MNYFFTAKAVDADKVVVANHTNDLSSLPFEVPEEGTAAGRFQLEGVAPGDPLEGRIAERIKEHAHQRQGQTILLRLGEGGEVVYWDIPKSFEC